MSNVNGVGVGMGIIQAAYRHTQQAHLRGLTAWYAAGAGAVSLRTCVPRPETTTIRLTGIAASVFALRGMGRGQRAENREQGDLSANYRFAFEL